jgi:hypothetical protein
MILKLFRSDLRHKNASESWNRNQLISTSKNGNWGWSGSGKLRFNGSMGWGNGDRRSWSWR